MYRNLPFLLKQLRSQWSKLPTRRQGAAVLAIPATFLVLTLGSWAWSRKTAIDLQTKIDGTETIITTSNNLFTALLRAETSVRGYSITYNDRFLTPYNQAFSDIPISLSQLNRALEGTPQKAQHLQQLRQLTQKCLDLLEERLRLLSDDQQMPGEATELINLLYEKESAMAELQLVLNKLQAEERISLEQYKRKAVNLRNITSALLWLTVSISLLGYLTAIYLFSQLDWEIRERDVQLNESKSLIQTIVTNVVDGVVTLDKNGRIEILNPAAAYMFGYNPDELMGENLAYLLEEPNAYTAELEEDKGWFSPQERPSFWSNPKFQMGRPWQGVGYHKMGRTFPIEISISDMKQDNRMIAIIRDITERKQAEERLQTHADELARLNLLLANANTHLENRNQELDQFAYVASHDLKAPLRAIANLSEWLEEDLQEQLPEENLLHMQLLRQRVHRMEALINGLLDYSRIGRTHTKSEKVSVRELLEEIIDSLAPPPSFNITLTPELPTLRTKRVLLRQVFANLINNAIKHHNRPDGNITIGMNDLGKAYEFSVADDGKGIDPRYHAKIFTIFQTLEARDKVENTGVGLSIVKKIVETEGGNIRLESQLGQGTTFYFTWLKS
jgi:PAS domain S-box-containing protein